MKCLRMVKVVIVILLTGLFFISQAYADGKKIFLDNKCNKCHTFKKLGIEKLPKKALAAEDDGEEADEEVLDKAGKKIEPKDMLDAVVASKKAKLDIGKWLKKEATIEDRKHKKKFQGTEGDLKILVDWLNTF